MERWKPTFFEKRMARTRGSCLARAASKSQVSSSEWLSENTNSRSHLGRIFSPSACRRAYRAAMLPDSLSTGMVIEMRGRRIGATCAGASTAAFTDEERLLDISLEIVDDGGDGGPEAASGEVRMGLEHIAVVFLDRLGPRAQAQQLGHAEGIEHADSEIAQADGLAGAEIEHAAGAGRAEGGDGARLVLHVVVLAQLAARGHLEARAAAQTGEHLAEKHE